MTKELFFDYGELLFGYRFTQETLRRADKIFLPQLARFGSEATRSDLSRAHKQTIQVYLQARNKTGEEWPMERIMDSVLANIGVRDELATKLSVEVYKLNDHDEFPLPGIIELVPELARNNRLHIISNLPHNSPIETLREHDLLRHFRTITFSYEAGYRKPRPEIYLLALQRAQCSPDQGLFISHDQEEVDGARRVGMQAHLATNADEIRGALHENPLH